MPNNQPQNPSDEGIELPPEALSGEPGDKVPGLETEEEKEGVTGGTMEAMQKFSDWEKDIEELSPEDMPEFISKLGQEMKDDKLLKTYPELRFNYLNVRAKALQKAGPLALDILSKPGEKPIDSVLQEMKQARETKNTKVKKYIYEKNENDLSAIINGYEAQLASPDILPAQKEKTESDLKDAKELKDTVEQFKSNTIQ
ncbi:MAG: hypothetical protein GF365_05230 [Candidatus Buchananbacteria bacterium]|nr:hypothetical protein [Candidatus Buchananbacteria bacterium]